MKNLNFAAGMRRSFVSAGSFCDKNTDGFAIEMISFCLHLIQNNFEVSICLKLPAVTFELELNRFLFYPTSRFDLLAFFV